jgi:hypothetical protein
MANDPSYGHPRRSIRIPDELWHAAMGTAAERKETVPEVVRRGLERYVARHRREPPGEEGQS